MSRVSRGFHRLGIAVAVPIVGLALVMAALAWHGSRPLPLCTGMFDDLVPAAGARPTCLQPAPGSTDRGPWDLYRGTYSQTEVYGGTPDYVPAGAVLLTALGLYIAFRAAGWVIKGFS